VLVEGLDEPLGDIVRLSTLDVMALQQEHELPVPEKPDLGAGGCIPGKVAPGPFHGLEFHAREDGGQLVGNHVVLNGQADARARLAGGAATDRVHDHKDGAAALAERPIHVVGRQQLLEAEAGKLVPHWLDENRIVSQLSSSCRNQL
jgi:hypothetical protein